MKRKLSDYPEWVQAVKKLGELHLERDQHDSERRHAENLKDRLAEARTSLLEREAQALLGGEQVEDADIEALRSKIANSARRHQVVCKAIEIHKKIMEDLNRKFSMEIIEALKPEYKQLQVALAKKALELAALTEQEYKFREELESGGICVCYLATNPLRCLGRLADNWSKLNIWLQEGEKAGYFNRSSL